MKRFIILLAIIFVIVFGALRLAKAKVVHDLAQPVLETILSPVPTPTLLVDQNQKTTTSVIIPYWAVGDPDASLDSYDQLIYFGITPDANGIASEIGFSRIDQFEAMVPQGKQTLLALRMVDSDQNSAILKNKALQQKIITQTIAFAQAHNFSGVVLDLEMSAIPFDTLVTQITSFNNDLGVAAKKAGKSYGLTLYGDTFYRVRPFDVKALSQNADSILVMAYDFSKSRANPGPNFPLKGQEMYGYDYAKMTEDYLNLVPSKKIGIIFGLFGYDWVVDSKGNALAQGTPLTYEQIKQKFLDDCPYTDCQIKRDAVSAETKITYTDEDGKKHVIWFEDMQSVSAKEVYLKTRDISNFSFWAYSYF